MIKAFKRISRGEKILYSIAFLMLLLLVLPLYFGSAEVNNLRIKNERLKIALENQKNTNESLAIKVNELTSFAKVNEIVKNMGLVYNYKNVVNIEQ